MSTEQIWQTESTSLSDSLALGELLGKKLRGGEVIELISDLGGGKTTLTKGLAKGVGSSDLVKSPSFTISNQYKSAKLTIYHFDFYRLSEPGIMRQELAEILTDKKAVVVIEWGNIVEDLLPSDRISINITSTGDTTRQFTITCSQRFLYVLPESKL